MSKKFERSLESATDQTLVEPNWEAILECVDLIRGGDIPAKQALSLIQKRYHNENPHVAHHGLLVLEACVKNCGKKFHDEIATKEFMNDFKNIVIEGAPDKVASKVLELIQCWSFAFREKAEYKIVGDTHTLLKMNGFDFPTMKEADAMFVADSAPEWADGSNCFRCRVEFGLLTRKHHCRACGQVFCDKCTSYQMLLPQYGIEKKVRVCGICYDKQMKKQVLSAIVSSAGKSSFANPTSKDLSTADDEAEKARLQEEEELQLALAISQSEAEAKEQDRQKQMYRLYNGAENVREPVSITSTLNQMENPSSFYNGAKNDDTETVRSVPKAIRDVPMEVRADGEPPIDPNLAKYLDRDYWERKKIVNGSNRVQIRATAPPPSEISMSLSSRASVETTTPTNFNNTMMTQNGFSACFEHQNGSKYLSEATLAPFMDGISQMKISNPNSSTDDEVSETTQFCKQLKEQVDIMDNRMKSNLMRGRSIVNDSAIHSLFVQLTDLHAGVMTRIAKLESDREYYERLQDHIAHINEARQAVDSLRDEHERQRQERLMEEQRQRQLQMQQKLEYMRVKKHEMLVHQRHLALQRFQEHEQQIQQMRMQQIPMPGNYYVTPSYPTDAQQFVQHPGYAIPPTPLSTTSSNGPNVSQPESVISSAYYSQMHPNMVCTNSSMGHYYATPPLVCASTLSAAPGIPIQSNQGMPNNYQQQSSTQPAMYYQQPYGQTIHSYAEPPQYQPSQIQTVENPSHQYQLSQVPSVESQTQPPQPVDANQIQAQSEVPPPVPKIEEAPLISFD